MRFIQPGGLLVLLVLAFVPSAWSQCTGPWTLVAQQPSNCVPYAGSLWSTRLPTDVLSHLAPNSDAIASAMVNQGITSFPDVPGGALLVWANPGPSEADHIPVYYGQASDPWWVINGCATSPFGVSLCGSPGDPQYPVGTYWHIPTYAHFTWNEQGCTGPGVPPGRGTNDTQFSVYDQTTNKILKLFATASSCGNNGAVSPSFATNGPSCGQTQASACVLGAPRSYISGLQGIIDQGAALSFAYTGQVYQLTSESESALAEAPSALLIRGQEMISSVIPHALHLAPDCTNATQTVFPSNTDTTLSCTGTSVSPANRPFKGSLFFLDYTDAQIDSFNLPAWQKPIVVALAHYGAYASDTTSVGNEPIQLSYDESMHPYQEAGISPIPIENFLTSNGLNCVSNNGYVGASPCRYFLTFFQNLPSIATHLHIADPCIAKGMAGVAGGCGTPFSSGGLQPPGNLRITGVGP